MNPEETLARTPMEEKVIGRRTSRSLPESQKMTTRSWNASGNVA
jgi:hypothetical protein